MFPLMPSTPTVMPSPTPTGIPPSNLAPSYVTSLITLFLSFNALGDWLKFILIGGLLESFRRLLFSVWRYIVKSLWITVDFEQEDASYDWLMVWLSQQQSRSNTREISISTRSFGLNSRAVIVPGEEKESSNLKSTRRVAYLPSFNSFYSMWYKRHYIRISRSKTQHPHHNSETVTLKIFARDMRIVDALLLEAKQTWNQAQVHYISIYASDASNHWRQIASRPKRPLRSIVLDDGIKELLLDDARDFLDSKCWYSDRGIPFRRGYLLHGAPGSGKTSIIHSLAGELGLNVYVISLSRAGLDDNALQGLVADLPERCIALMEDIDAAFHQTINRCLLENDANGISGGHDSPNQPRSSPEQLIPTSRISLSGLLNALDGVGAQEGRLLFATTNRYSALDSALCRPGRMDLHVEFKLASRYQACELFKCFYMPPGFVEDEERDDDGDGSVDSGYGTPSISTEADDKLVDVEPSVTRENLAFVGASHKVKAPRLASCEINVLAQKFGDAIPHREFSMASLQGYLMSYKVRPFEAAAFASKWVDDQRSKMKSGLNRDLDSK